MAAAQAEAPAANWYDGAIVAYQPLGAASYADSKINLANPGTYDAVEGVAPSWTSGAGWDANGIDSYLEAGTTSDFVFVGNGEWTVLALIKPPDPLIDDGPIISTARQSNERGFGFKLKTSGMQFIASNGANYLANCFGPVATAGTWQVVGIRGIESGGNITIDFSKDGSVSAAASGDAVYPTQSWTTTEYPLYLMKDTVGQWHKYIGAIVVYDQALTGSQISAISAAMAAL